MKISFPMLVTAAGLLASCSPLQPNIDNATGAYAFRQNNGIRIKPEVGVAYGWWDVPAGTAGQHKIVIDTQMQEAKYYIGGKWVGYSRISSGKAGHGTPAGTFSVLAKDADHTSSKYGSIVDAAGNTLVGDYTMGSGKPIPAGGIYKGAAMTNGMQLTNTGIWMHEGIVTSAPESHGCIRLPREMAKIFFDNTPVGTPVVIR